MNTHGSRVLVQVRTLLDGKIIDSDLAEKLGSGQLDEEYVECIRGGMHNTSYVVQDVLMKLAGLNYYDAKKRSLEMTKLSPHEYQSVEYFTDVSLFTCNCIDCIVLCCVF